MNVYLDDCRTGPFNEMFCPPAGWEDWVIVRSVENAKALLSAGLVDKMSLDHDLGQNSITGELNPDGKKLVLWMVETNTWPKGRVDIHSQNFNRAVEMRELIDRYRPSKS
jgi:hypothetical protein